MASKYSLVAFFIGLTKAISLSSFQPQSTNLTNHCRVIYDTQIPGCREVDFSNGNGCSSACINGLASISNQVYAFCSGSAQNENHLVGAFITGNGIPLICGNVVVEVVTVPATSAISQSQEPSVTTTTQVPSVTSTSANDLTTITTTITSHVQSIFTTTETLPDCPTVTTMSTTVSMTPAPTDDGQSQTEEPTMTTAPPSTSHISVTAIVPSSVCSAIHDAQNGGSLLDVDYQVVCEESDTDSGANSMFSAGRFGVVGSCLVAGIFAASWTALL